MKPKKPKDVTPSVKVPAAQAHDWKKLHAEDISLYDRETKAAVTELTATLNRLLDRGLVLTCQICASKILNVGIKEAFAAPARTKLAAVVARHEARARRAKEAK